MTVYCAICNQPLDSANAPHSHPDTPAEIIKRVYADLLVLQKIGDVNEKQAAILCREMLVIGQDELIEC